MKKPVFTIAITCGIEKAFSCTTCNKNLQKGIFNSTFYPNLLTMLLAFLILGLIVLLLCFLALRREQKTVSNDTVKNTSVPLIAAATTLGIGIGGFIDGIFLHQILQWHEMLSNKLPPLTLLNKSINMFWDGIFHAFCLVVLLTGLILMLNLSFRKNVLITKSSFWGGMLLGWGLFNLVEGIIDHQILKLHNVKETSNNIALWNYGFLFFALFLVFSGSMLIRKRANFTLV